MKKSVIILEDEIIIAMMLREFLLSQQYVVNGIAKDGKTTIDLVEDSKPDLLILDVHITGPMNGIETFKKINSQHKIPAVFLTGNMQDVLQLKNEYNNVYVMEKPVSLTELKKTVDAVFSTHK